MSKSVRPTASWLRQLPVLSAEDTANETASVTQYYMSESKSSDVHHHYWKTILYGNVLLISHFPGKVLHFIVL